MRAGGCRRVQQGPRGAPIHHVRNPHRCVSADAGADSEAPTMTTRNLLIIGGLGLAGGIACCVWALLDYLISPHPTPGARSQPGPRSVFCWPYGSKFSDVPARRSPSFVAKHAPSGERAGRGQPATSASCLPYNRNSHALGTERSDRI